MSWLAVQVRPRDRISAMTWSAGLDGVGLSSGCQGGARLLENLFTRHLYGPDPQLMNTIWPERDLI